MSDTLKLPPSTLCRSAFVERFGGIYEHSPWVAERVFDGGLDVHTDTTGGLAARMAAVVEAAGHEAQLSLLRAHPELAGKLAVLGGLTADSKAEQSSARLDHCTPEEFRRFNVLNERYTRTFGFPFIIAVRGLTRLDILKAFEARIDHAPETEFRAALDQVHRIARLRLDGMTG